jgi:hypothetical protein
MMLLIPSRRPHWATRWLAPLSALLMAAVAAPAGAAAPNQPGTEAPPPSFVLPAKPSELLKAPAATWKPLLDKVGAALDERGKALLLLGKPALIELNVQRTIFSQTQRDWPAVFEAIKKTRQLQGSEAGRQTAGLLNEALARQAVSRGDAAWLHRHLRDQVLAMPWAEVELGIRLLRQQLASMKAESIEAFVGNKLDLSASAAENKANLGFVMQLLAMRFQLHEVLPRQEVLVAALDEAIAQRSAGAASAVGK